MSKVVYAEIKKQVKASKRTGVTKRGLKKIMAKTDAGQSVDKVKLSKLCDKWIDDRYEKNGKGILIKGAGRCYYRYADASDDKVESTNNSPVTTVVTKSAGSNRKKQKVKEEPNKLQPLPALTVSTTFNPKWNCCPNTDPKICPGLTPEVVIDVMGVLWSGINNLQVLCYAV